MSEVQVGVTTWDNKVNTFKPGQQGDVRRFKFVRLTNGNNVMRFVTPPFRYFFARVRSPQDKNKFGNRVNISYPKYDDCPAIAAGLKAKERYYVGVLDLSDREIKILDMSVLVYEQMQEIRADFQESKGREVNPVEFNVNIRYNKDATSPAGYYKVLPREVEPLSEDNQAIVDEAMEDLVKNLELKSTCWRPETVTKRMADLGWTPEFQAKIDEEERREKEAKKLAEAKDEDYDFNDPNTSATAEAN